MSLLRRVGARIGVYDYSQAIRAAYTESLAKLNQPNAETGAFTPHQSALFGVFVQHDEPRPAHVRRDHAALIHTIPFMSLSHDRGLRGLTAYVCWRNHVKHVDIGTLSQTIKKGLKALERDESGLKEVLYEPFQKDPYMRLVLAVIGREGWGALLPFNAVYGSFYKGPSGVAYIRGVKKSGKP